MTIHMFFGVVGVSNGYATATQKLRKTLSYVRSVGKNQWNLALAAMTITIGTLILMEDNALIAAGITEYVPEGN